jgi:RNA-binding protein YhbY
MPTLQEVYYTEQNKQYTDEQAEQMVREVREQLQHDVIKVVHASNNLSATDYQTLGDSLCQAITEYFDDEYGM